MFPRILIILLLLASSGCELRTDTATLVYRLDAQIEVDGVERRGTAIQAVTMSAANFPTGYNDGRDTKWWGEAVGIRTGRGGVVFLLLDNPRAMGGYGDDIVRRCGIIDQPMSGMDAVVALRDFEGSCVVSTTDTVPFVVAMSDENEPGTLFDPGDRVMVRKLTLTKVNGPLADTLPRYDWMRRAFGTKSPKWEVSAKPRSYDVWLDKFFRRVPAS
jgi:hypothetical protein